MCLYGWCDFFFNFNVLLIPVLHDKIAGIAIALESGIIFPAEFPWNNFEDFSTQLKDRVSRRTGGGALLSDDDKHKTKLSTFKPKALRNPNTYKNLQTDSKEKDKKG